VGYGGGGGGNYMPDDYHMHPHSRGDHRSGSDGEDDLVHQVTSRDSMQRGHHPLSALQGHHGGVVPSSLRRQHQRGGGSRQAPVIYQSPSGLVGHPSSTSTENPYQQPYLPGRSAGLSDSPTSENGSADTLTDPELPFATSALPLQNGKREGECVKYAFSNLRMQIERERERDVVDERDTYFSEISK